MTANSNGLPQITTPSGTRTISHIHLRNDATFDAVGIRVAGSALSYSASDAVSWSGQGTLPYPIGDFTVTAVAEYFYSTFGPYFAAAGTQGTPTSGGLRLVVSSTPRALVPEPKEYALVFGLLALGFVLFRHQRRHYQKKRCQQAATS